MAKIISEQSLGPDDPIYKGSYVISSKSSNQKPKAEPKDKAKKKAKK